MGAFLDTPLTYAISRPFLNLSPMVPWFWQIGTQNFRATGLMKI